MDDKNAMRKGMLLFGFLGIFCCCSNVQGRSLDVQSPDGKLKVVIDLKEKIYYSVISQNDTILKDQYFGKFLPKN